MNQINWLKQLGTSFFGRSCSARLSRHGWHERRHLFTRPCLENLEERCLLSGGITSPTGLVNAIANANAAGGGTVTLSSGYTFNFTTANSSILGTALPPIGGNITIVGNGDLIQRSPPNDFRFFDVFKGGSLTLQDLTLEGGLTKGTGTAAVGGAIYSSGALTLTGVTVLDNVAEGTAGSNGTPNHTQNGGSGANAAGGGIYVAGGTLVLSNDTIKLNAAYGGQGGDAFGHKPSSHDMPSTGFTGYNGGPGGNAWGGGVYVAGGSITMNGDTFASNSAVGGLGGSASSGRPRGSGGGIGGKGGDAVGGGVYVAQYGFTLSQDSFTNNTVKGGNGGAGGYGSTHDNAGAGGNGGAASGGGLFEALGGLTLSDVHLISNTVNGGSGGPGGASGMHGPGTGGNGGDAYGGGLSATNLEGITTLIGDTLIYPDTLKGGAAGGTPGGLVGKTAGPALYGYAISIFDPLGRPLGSTLPPATEGKSYAFTIEALDISGGGAKSPKLICNPISSTLGLNFDVNSGGGGVLLISGTPTAAGTVTFSVTATDSNGSTTPQVYTITINPSPPPPGGSSGGSGSNVSAPPSLNVPPLLAFFDSLLGGTETVNTDGTETITDDLFGFPLLVATFDNSGKLVSVDLFGIDVTFLFG